MAEMRRARDNMSLKLKQIMGDRKMNADYIATLAGVSRSSVIRALNGQNMKLDLAEDIANALGLSLAQMVAGGNSEKLPHDVLPERK